MPTIWLFLSGLFFLVNTFFLATMIVVMLRIAKVAQELKPKIDTISDRVESIAVKVDSIAGKVDHMTTNLQGTVQTLSQRGTKVADSADIIAGITSANFSRFAPYISVIAAALKAIQLLKSAGVRMPKVRQRRNVDSD